MPENLLPENLICTLKFLADMATGAISGVHFVEERIAIFELLSVTVMYKSLLYPLFLNLVHVLVRKVRVAGPFPFVLDTCPLEKRWLSG